MNITHTPYSMPDNYDPHASLDTIRGLTDAIARYLVEGPGTEAHIPANDFSGFVALVEELAKEARAFHDWFRDIENRTSLELPRSEADFQRLHVRHQQRDDGVREPAPLYCIN